MTKRRDRNSENAEVHRLKNRVRQQRYRARKREQNAKRGGQTPLLADVFFSSVPNVTNRLPLLTHDLGSLIPKDIQSKNGARSADSGPEGTDGYLEDAKGDADISSRDILTLSSHEIQQPSSQMEHEYELNTLKMQDGYAMKSLDQRVHNRSHNDIMARRLKNRERQRRYRARKRLEADMKNAYLMNQSTPLTPESQPSGVMIKCCCKRDWKEDARRAHAMKEPEVSTELRDPSVNFASEDQACISHLHLDEVKIKSENPVSLRNYETNGVTDSRRNWKMAARNKVD